ncbi:hypothetical protein HD554DRAFT_2042147 [Boletus coccyginus]|nr:hypothetical protein HD554DRAFT_2042147 [Boletus coccyginus]
MTDNLDSGKYKIVSLSRGDPLGVGLILPAWQTVSVNGPVHDWTLHKVGDHKYKLSVGGYGYTGVLDGKVIASIHPEHAAEWEITHHERQNAFTIALAKKHHLGWTVPTNLGDGKVGIQLIIIGPSEPPTFLTSQLFLIEKHH